MKRAASHGLGSRRLRSPFRAFETPTEIGIRNRSCFVDRGIIINRNRSRGLGSPIERTIFGSDAKIKEGRSDISRKMDRENALRPIYLAFLSMLLVNSALCINKSNYTEYGLDQERVCHPNDRKMKLSEALDLALIITEKHTFDSWMVLHDKKCHFVIKANKGDGLFGTIQKMSFRHNGTHCIDFVQFIKGPHEKGEPVCGKIDQYKSEDYLLLHPNHSSVFSSLSKDGAKLETKIFISKKKLLPRESLALTLVYTPVKQCSKVNQEEYKQVGVQGEQDICIQKQYICDGIQNYPSYTYSDEANCSNPPTLSTGTGTKVTIGAVTLMLLSIIIFFGCIWICKRYHLLFWSSDCAGPNVQSRTGTLVCEPVAHSNQQTPAVLDVAVPAPLLDKDLPPSYESLFPEQSNRTT